MAIKTHKVTLSLDNPRVIQSGINVQSFDKQSIQISIELTKNDEVFQVPSDATIRVSLLKLARQEQKIIVDVPNTNRDSIDWIVPDYLDGYQGTVRVGVYLVSGTENVDLGYFTILSNVSDIDKMADEFTDNVFQGWEQIEADLNELNLTIAQTKIDLAEDLTQIDNTIANINAKNTQVDTLASDFEADVATKQSDVTSKYNEFDTSVTTANQTIGNILALQPQFQAVLDETTGKDVISAPEIILARGGATTLGERLDNEKAEVSAQLAQTETNLSDQLSIDSFGAIGDGVTDDTQAIKDAIEYIEANGGDLIIPAKTYLITEPLVFNQPIKIRGFRNMSRIKKENATVINIDGVSINSVIIIRTRFFEIEGVNIQGNISNNVNGFSFGEGASEFTFSNLGISQCFKAFDDYKTCWLGDFNKIYVVHCVNAFVFTGDNDKTAMTFTNTWAENCGQAYAFKRLYYSTLQNTGADWCNFESTDNPYGVGYGSRKTHRGVYDFELCRGVSLMSIGAENSYGNGVVRMNACVMTLTGLTAINIKSTYEPNYANDPSQRVGVIVLTSERNRLNVNTVYIDNFENSFVKDLRPNEVQPLIAYNYSTGSYGLNDSKMVIASNVMGSHTREIFGGIGDNVSDFLNLDNTDKITTVKEYIELNDTRIYPSRVLTGDGSNKISIPITSQNNINYTHFVTLKGIDDGYNSTNVKAFTCDISFTSLIDVERVSVVTGSTGVTAEGSGSNLIVTLPQTYNRMKLNVSITSQRKNYLDIEGITLI